MKAQANGSLEFAICAREDNPKEGVFMAKSDIQSQLCLVSKKILGGGRGGGGGGESTFLRHLYYYGY